MLFTFVTLATEVKVTVWLKLAAPANMDDASTRDRVSKLIGMSKAVAFWNIPRVLKTLLVEVKFTVLLNFTVLANMWLASVKLLASKLMG